MSGIVSRALERTAPLWPDIERAAQWVREATAILDNPDQCCANTVRQRYWAWVAQLEHEGSQEAMSDSLRKAAQHFAKVTRSYGADLFHCYDMPNLPRTNNALEQTFGSVRYHERRASGRKVASPSLVLNGSSRLPAAFYTRTCTVTVSMLASVKHERWRAARAEHDRRRQARCMRCRFRKNPEAYLSNLAEMCGKLNLPS